jgi:hypothetical protein
MTRMAVVSLLLTFLGCTDSRVAAGSTTNSAGPAGGDGGGGGGAGGTGEPECPVGQRRARIPGALVDPAGGCVRADPTGIVLVDVCLQDPATPTAPSFYCIARVSDGSEVWVRHRSSLFPMPGSSRACVETPGPVSREIPPPCFATSCPIRDGGSSAPGSLCSEETTRRILRCGESQSSWDEDCCLRTSCVDGAADACEGGECVALEGAGWTQLAYEYEATEAATEDWLNEACRGYPFLSETPQGYCF